MHSNESSAGPLSRIREGCFRQPVGDSKDDRQVRVHVDTCLEVRLSEGVKALLEAQDLRRLYRQLIADARAAAPGGR